MWHARSAWVKDIPVVGPSLNWTTIDTVVIHYTAAINLIDGDLREYSYAIPPYIRAIHRDYTVNRGYSIGYNEAFDWLGGNWELRGEGIKCAANRDHNDHTYAFLMLVDGSDRATELCAEAVRNRIAALQVKYNRGFKIVGHGQLQSPNHPTACPGIGLRYDIDNMVFNPRPVGLTIPKVEEDMNTATIVRVRGFWNTWLIGAGPAISLNEDLFKHYVSHNVPVVVTAYHEQLISGLLLQSGTSLAQLVSSGEV